MTHHTTLAMLRKHGACKDRYAYLAAILDGMSIEEAKAEETKHEYTSEFRDCSFSDDKPIPLIGIMTHNGIDDAIWALRANLHPESDKYSRLFACDCAEHVLHIFEKECPKDKRPREAIDIARRFANGGATEQEMAAAWAAAGAAAGAAWAAAGADGDAWAAGAAGAAWAAWAAAGAARDAARAAAGAAGWAAARKWQAAKFIEIFG